MLSTAHFRIRTTVTLLTLAASVMLSSAAQAETAIGYRLGSFGFGLTLEQQLTEQVSARAGYNLYRYGQQANSSGVDYAATATIKAASLLVDWQLGPSAWRVTGGIAQSGILLRADGTATGTVTFNGQTYNASELGSLRAEFGPAHSLAPYVGLGYGRATAHDGRVHFLVDLGALYLGSPRGRVTATCASGATQAQCQQLLSDIQAELEDYQQRWRRIRWWPVLSVGFALNW